MITWKEIMPSFWGRLKISSSFCWSSSLRMLRIIRNLIWRVEPISTCWEAIMQRIVLQWWWQDQEENPSTAFRTVIPSIWTRVSKTVYPEIWETKTDISRRYMIWSNRMSIYREKHKTILGRHRKTIISILLKTMRKRTTILKRRHIGWSTSWESFWILMRLLTDLLELRSPILIPLRRSSSKSQADVMSYWWEQEHQDETTTWSRAATLMTSHNNGHLRRKVPSMLEATWSGRTVQ